MPIRVLEIHHPAVRIGSAPGDIDAARQFYGGVLGLGADEKRPDFAGIPGLWINVGAVGQIHLIGGAQPSPLAKSPDQDPTASHVALAVADVVEAKDELDRTGVAYWSLKGATGPHSEQLFLRDPFGNMIELHQVDQCRCRAASRDKQ
jgi:catechol 2,3-dioxygenase-like lactoylglutathione lyase family enzyme